MTPGGVAHGCVDNAASVLVMWLSLNSRSDFASDYSFPEGHESDLCILGLAVRVASMKFRMFSALVV